MYIVRLIIKLLIETFRYVGGITILFKDTIYWVSISFLKNKKSYRARIFDQMVFVGVNSLLIVFFVAIFTGIVIAMQSAYQLTRFGGLMYVAALVSISICRELSPVLVSLVVAGRVGAAITAEIGSMKVTEQIEALDAMALNPVGFLVVPRFLSLLVMLPCLVILGDLIGIFGGFLVGVSNLNISSGVYMTTTFKFLTFKDIFTGIFKSAIFAIIIAMVSCYEGLSTKGGAEGVGKSTTLSVVASFILIILADSVLTAIFYFSKI